MRLTAAFAFLLACAPVAPGPQTSGARTEITLNAEAISSRSILLTLRNDSARPVAYNLCASALELRAAENWQPVRTDTICTMELRNLASRETATFTQQLPSSLGAGEYRFVTGVESPVGSPRIGIASNSFRIP